MSEETLKQLARGAGIIFISTFLMYAIKFIYRIAIARYLGPEDYGLLSIGIMVLNVAILLSVIGLNEGLVRYMAFYRGKNEFGKVKGSLLAALKISIILSIILSIIITVFSKFISIQIFHNERLIPILAIFALVIPLYTILIMMTNAILSFKKPEYNLISRVFGREFINLILALSVVLIGGTVLGISFAYLISMAIGAALSIFLFERKVFSFLSKKIKAVHNYKPLLQFSVPLFFSDIFINIMLYADTFFLGIYRSASEVGIYNVALPLAASLGIFLTTFSQIFYPIMSELHAKKKYDELNKNYSTVLRWIFMSSLPVVLLVIMFPENILGLLFGKEYILGSSALVILISAYFIDVITGPAVRILMTFKRTKLVFAINVFSAVVNIILNIILIPNFGISGAALATGIAIVVREIIILLFARKIIRFKIIPKQYAKYILSATIPLSILYRITRTISLDSYIYIGITFILFLLTYLTCLILLKSFTNEDLIIIHAIEKKLGLNLNFLDKIIKV